MSRDFNTTVGNEPSTDIIDRYEQLILDETERLDVYLAEWAFSLLSELLTLNMGTVAYRFKKFLEHTLYTEHEKAMLVTNAQRLLKESTSTVYYPSDIKINQIKKRIKIQGTFITHIRQNMTPVIGVKTFLLTYLIGENDIYLIDSLEEISNDQY